MKSTTKNQTVYIIQAEGTPHYKIGVTTNVQDRVKGIQTGCPHRIIVRAIYRGNEQLERKLHDHFNTYRGFGEWFTLPYNWQDMIAGKAADQPIAPDPAQPTKSDQSPIWWETACHLRVVLCGIGVTLAGWAALSALLGLSFYDVEPVAAVPALAAIVTVFHRPLLRLSNK